MKTFIYLKKNSQLLHVYNDVRLVTELHDSVFVTTNDLEQYEYEKAKVKTVTYSN